MKTLFGAILDKFSERLLKKARALGDLRVLHINSTRHGGGVAEILSSLVPLMNAVGITSDWHVIDGPPEFFGFTKEIHNALHGEAVDLTEQNADGRWRAEPAGGRTRRRW